MKLRTKKTNLYKAEKMENLAETKIKSIKDPNQYKGIKDIRYLFNDNIYKDIIDPRYLFNEECYVKKLDSKNIKSELKNLSNNLVVAYARDITYMVDYINKGEKLTERPINIEDIRDL